MAQIEIVCHKGANSVAPENTYAAAEKCIAWGMDYVEVDVRTSQDGVFYLLHDPTLERTTRGQGYLHEKDSTYIDTLDAGSWFHSDFADQRVPRLEPFLTWIKGRAKLFFDVKAADAQRLVELVYATGFERECFFWSGSNVWAKQLRSLDPTLQLKMNVRTIEDVIHVHNDFHANIVEVGLENVNQPLLDACQARNMRVMVYQQVADPIAFRQIIKWDVEMINLNHGDIFAKILSEHQAQAQHQS